MNILLITNRYPKGPDDSASPFVPGFVRALRTFGAKVVVLTPLYGSPPDEDDPQVFRFRFGQTNGDTPIGSWGMLNPRTWMTIPRFVSAGEAAAEDLLSGSSINHILALWALPSGWFARRASRKWGVPYSVWCLGSDINVWARRPMFRGMTQRILRDAATVFADGFRLANAAGRLSGRHCRFLASFRALNSDASGTMAHVSGRPYFLYAGRICRQKGVFDLLDAFIRARSVLDCFDLVFLGDGPDRHRLQAAARRAGIAGRVQVLGDVSTAELAEHYRAAQATVIPSCSDSLPLVFSEAVQCGSPVIVYDSGDLGHFVRRFNLGRVVSRGDVAALSCSLVCAKTQPLDITKGSAMVREFLHPQRAAQRFLKAIATDTLDDYDPVLKHTCEGEVPAG